MLAGVSKKIKSIANPSQGEGPVPVSHRKQSADTSHVSEFNMSISPKNIPSVLESIESKKINQTQEYDNLEIPPNNKPLQKVVVERFPLIAGLFSNIGYVQVDPLPSHIAYLQESGLRGLEFVKIPISPKTDRLYLRNSIKKLLFMCGANWDDMELLIDIYNQTEEIPQVLADQGWDTKSIRRSLLALFDFAKFCTDLHEIEFLDDPEQLKN